jgi:pterin-4a-carbinolamine dehydratase
VVTLTLWTHASGGITGRDFRFADAIERILSSPAG